MKRLIMTKYVELPKEKIKFHGDTEKEKKANELIFDLTLENEHYKAKVKEVIRFMKGCIKDAKKLTTKKEYEILKKCYEYPLEILEKSDSNE